MDRPDKPTSVSTMVPGRPIGRGTLQMLLLSERSRSGRRLLLVSALFLAVCGVLAWLLWRQGSAQGNSLAELERLQGQLHAQEQAAADASGLRTKLAALESDLAALGRAPLRLDCVVTPPHSVAALIGMLYTLEGATQGGQYIARHLRQLPGPALPSTFFDAYGPLTQQRWAEFLQFAASHCPPAGHHDAVAAAVAMFEAVRQHLDAGLDRSGP